MRCPTGLTNPHLIVHAPRLARRSFITLGRRRRNKAQELPLFVRPSSQQEDVMGRGLLLWLIGIPIPIILLIWFFGGLG